MARNKAEETEFIPFSIRESRFADSGEALRVKMRLGAKSVDEALRIAERNGWLYDSVCINAICPGCGIFVPYTKNGEMYVGRCSNCLRVVNCTYPTADLFLESVYGEFYGNAVKENGLTREGKMSPCIICGSDKVGIFSDGSGKWSARCSECGRSLYNKVPRMSYAVAVWNQFALDSITLANCPECGTTRYVFAERLASGTFRCRCDKCGMVGIEGNSKSEAWRLWNRQVSPSDAAIGKPVAVDAVVSDVPDVIGGSLSTLEEENRYLRGLLARFIGVSLRAKDANASLAAALEPMHRASLASAEAIKAIPFEVLKEAPGGLKDFINECLTDKGERHDAN